MSWFFSLLFAGLAYASSGDTGSISQPFLIEADSPKFTVQTQEKESFQQTYQFSSRGRVSLSNMNGSVTVEAWDRNEVRVEYTKTASSRERLAEVDVTIDARADSISIVAEHVNRKLDKNPHRLITNETATVEFRLMVPKTADLNEIETVNGSVRLSNFANVVRVSTVNGEVHAANLRGTASLSSVNGQVNASFDHLAPSSKLSLDSVNGRVHLIVPSDVNATLKADTLNGVITNDFGLPVRKGRFVGRDLYGRIGSGDVQINLNSVNGPLTISRRNDGKAPSPATNLLPKGEDEERDAHRHASSAVIERETQRAVREHTRAAERAIADAKIKLKDIDPVLAKATADSLAAMSESLKNSVVIDSKLKEKLRAVTTQQQAINNAIADAMYFPSMPRVATHGESVSVKGVPTVTINADPASVKVTGWDRSEVHYKVVQYLEPRRANPLKAAHQSTDTSVTIGLEEPMASARPLGDGAVVKVEVMVPHRSNVKVRANGDVRMDGVSGDIDIKGSEGAINVRDGDGKLRVTTSEGRIRVIGFKGDVVATATDGQISLEGDFKKLTVTAQTGAVWLTLPNDASAEIETAADELEGEGIVLTRSGSSKGLNRYRIGNGGPVFRVSTDGLIRIRAAHSSGGTL